MKSYKEKISADLPVIFIAIFNVFIHLLVIGNLEYHRDELLYFSLGEHPALGFATVPPMIGWLAWLLQNTVGHGLFAVRILPALMSGVMILLVAAIAKDLGGSHYARVLSGIGFLIAGFALRSFSLFMPVFLDIFFWTFLLFLLVRYINSGKGKYLLYFGIAAGFSILNKYLIGVFFAGLLVIVPFTRYRNVFTKKMFWLGIAAGLLICSPNIIWQIINNLPVVNHLAELKRTQLVNVDRVTFLAEQLMMGAFASVLIIAGLFFILLNRKGIKYRFLGILVIFIIVVLMLLRGKSYYTIGIFPFLIAAGAVSFDYSLKRAWTRIVLPVMLVVLTIPGVPVGLPVYKSDGLVKYFHILETKYGIIIARRFEDNSIHSLPQDYADMLGWEELTSVADRAYSMIGDKKASFIYCENYGQAGAITIIGKKYQLPEPVSFNESFRYWIPRKFNPDITSVIYINSELGQDVQLLFNKITLVGKISNPDAREYGTSVYLCENPKSSFNEFWNNRLKILFSHH
ncbi:MAG: glycosyltransferase family 39 protein [Bacteroidales bacterium]